MIYINKINCYKYKFIKEIKKINKNIYSVIIYKRYKKKTIYNKKSKKYIYTIQNIKNECINNLYTGV